MARPTARRSPFIIMASPGFVYCVRLRCQVRDRTVYEIGHTTRDLDKYLSNRYTGTMRVVRRILGTQHVNSPLGEQILRARARRVFDFQAFELGRELFCAAADIDVRAVVCVDYIRPTLDHMLTALRVGDRGQETYPSIEASCDDIEAMRLLAPRYATIRCVTDRETLVVIGTSGNYTRHRTPSDAKCNGSRRKRKRRDTVRTRRGTDTWQALSAAIDISETIYNARENDGGGTSDAREYEMWRYELRAAFGEAMPVAPSAAWFEAYHLKTGPFRRLSMLHGRSHYAWGRDTSDGAWVVCAVQLIRAMGFANHLDVSTKSKDYIIAQLESVQAIVDAWNVSRKGVPTSVSRGLCTTIKAVKGILEVAIGVYITNVGTRRKPMYGIVGIHDRHAPRFKSGGEKKIQFKPPLWIVDDGDIAGEELLVAAELLHAGGYSGALDLQTFSKAALVDRLPAMYALVVHWNSARECASTDTLPQLSVMLNAANGILKPSLGVSIANVGTRKCPSYGVVGFHDWSATRVKCEVIEKGSSDPPRWHVCPGKITTRSAVV